MSKVLPQRQVFIVTAVRDLVAGAAVKHLDETLGFSDAGSPPPAPGTLSAKAERRARHLHSKRSGSSPS
jgi:hypothetical protein